MPALSNPRAREADGHLAGLSGQVVLISRWCFSGSFTGKLTKKCEEQPPEGAAPFTPSSWTARGRNHRGKPSLGPAA